MNIITQGTKNKLQTNFTPSFGFRNGKGCRTNLVFLTKENQIAIEKYIAPINKEISKINAEASDKIDKIAKKLDKDMIKKFKFSFYTGELK